MNNKIYNKVRLHFLKKKAKKLYTYIMNKYDSTDSGISLMEYISLDIYSKKQKFNRIWGKIQELDCNAPENPLE